MKSTWLKNSITKFPWHIICTIVYTSNYNSVLISLKKCTKRIVTLNSTTGCLQILIICSELHNPAWSQIINLNKEKWNLQMVSITKQTEKSNTLNLVSNEFSHLAKLLDPARPYI